MTDAHDLHAQLYHHQKITAAREEGERLKRELLLRGIDPGHVLVEAGLKRRPISAQNAPPDCL